MELRRIVLVLWRNAILLLVGAVLGALAGVGLYLWTAPTYAAKVTFYVSTPLAEGQNAQSAGQFAQTRVYSYLQVLKTGKLAQRVLAAQELNLTPDQVTAQLSASGDLNSVLITVVAKDGDKAVALSLAEGVAKVFPSLVNELDNVGRKSPLVVINTVSPPAALEGQVAPSLLAHLGGGIGLGLAFGFLLVLARELLGDTVKTAEEVEELTKLPLLGSVPYDDGVVSSPLIIGAQALAPRAEALRKVRSAIQFVGAANSTRCLALTSAMPGEGKTTTAVNLALSMASKSSSVVLVEGDMRRPQIAKLLDLAGEVGLSDVLAGIVDIDDAIQAWGDEGLFVLPSGSLPPNPADLLGLAEFGALIATLSQTFARVIIDLPPVLPVADAQIAAQSANAVAFVSRLGVTRAPQLTRAVSTLRAVGAPLVGSIVLQAKSRTTEEHLYPYVYSSSDPLPPEKQPGFLRLLRREQ